MNAQVMAFEARRHSVEHLTQHEAAGGRHHYPRLLMVTGATLGQRIERRPLEFETLAVLGVVASNDLVDEAAIGGEIGKVARATQKQRVLEGFLQMAMSALDRTVLMRDPAIVAGRLHAVVAHELLIVLS